MAWEEAGGPSIQSPIASGYGMQVIGGSAEQLGGEASFEWQSSGLRCFLVIPLGPKTKSFNKGFYEERIEASRSTSLAICGNRILVVEDEILVYITLSSIIV